MESLLGDILATVKLKSAIYFKHGFCGSWGMETPKGPYSQFHLVTGGHCVLSINTETFTLEKGDVAILPHGHAHQIKASKEAVCRLSKEALSEIVKGQQPFPGKEVSTQLICGHYELDRELSHQIFEELPSYIIIKSSDYGRYDLIYSMFELILEEMTLEKPGYETVSIRLAEILFISVIRHYYLHQASKKLNLFKDELIYEAVNIIHKELATPWNIEKLARRLGVSRTLFIERFKNAVGETPMKYITQWRMTKARYLLKKTDLPLPQISEKVGYYSETAFNRAFKQICGISPGKFRQSEAKNMGLKT